MRRHGCIDAGSGLGADGHACWGFEQPQEFVDATLEFFTDGLRSNRRLVYLSGEPVAEQRERLTPLGDVGAMVDRGALHLLELKDLYKLGEPVDPVAQVSLFTVATKAARADGYSGLSLATQSTEMVREPRTWEAHLRLESRADRMASAVGMSALCGYQRGALPEAVLGDLAAIHPTANALAEAAPFHLFGEAGGLALSGEIDHFSTPALIRALTLAHTPGEPTSLDLEALRFIDHHGFEALVAHTRRLAANGGCSIHNRPAIVDRLCGLLEMEL
ncbi:MAG TPA: MEDS domain-containing protein [Solirubrobacterales bacterium]|nr:MEDS domain-containing protein [Solirubrobacterales bacterium]